MRVGVLAVQGAFAEMAAYWRTQGADTFEIRLLTNPPSRKRYGGQATWVICCFAL